MYFLQKRYKKQEIKFIDAGQENILSRLLARQKSGGSFRIVRKHYK